MEHEADIGQEHADSQDVVRYPYLFCPSKLKYAKNVNKEQRANIEIILKLEQVIREAFEGRLGNLVGPEEEGEWHEEL